MQIRREDEEFIHSLKMLGAILGMVLSVLAVLRIRDNANDRLAEQRESLDQYALLLVATGMTATNEEGKKDIETVGEFVSNVNETKSGFAELGNEFWAKLSFTGLVGICVGAGVGGLLGGYFSIWVLSWIGTVMMFKFIRSAYGIMWHLKPDFDGGRPEAVSNDEGKVKRDTDRILPGIVKLSLMAIVGLAILAIVILWVTR